MKRLTRAVLAALIFYGVMFAGEQENNARVLRWAVLQVCSDSPVAEGMLSRAKAFRHDVQIMDGTLPPTVLATTELVGKRTIYITVDVAKVRLERHSLIATIVHELVHADDMATDAKAFLQMEEEDRALPWADRRLEKRAAQKTSIVMAYLALQFPDQYKAFEPVPIIWRTK